ncbi:hypothetical protein M9H77_28785 [Catharanthus roseus]|uniref:Uncharacterized protein n=1 Tax=Catharanthus roseus TaxID=4058 RepID=A0ACC0AHS2_CATRO|nr:hypothetical protein M9H77_28785 [Catharanthus roseus]
MSYLNGYSGMIMALFLFLQIFPSFGLWFWFSSGSSGKTENTKQFGENSRISRDTVAEFSIAPFTDRRGMKKLEDARNKIAIAAPNSCWQRAYNSLFSGCSKTLSDEESRNRFAWHLTDCFLQHAGRNTLPYCDPKSPVEKCLKVVDREAVNVYLEYHLETNSICHQLQIEAFRQQTERLVNELKTSAEYAESKLENIEEQGEQLLQSSRKIDDSLRMLDQRAQRVAEVSKNVENVVHDVFDHTKEVYEQSKGIASSQMELSQGQAKMKESLEEGMSMINEYYSNLGQEIDSLRNEAVEIEKEINKVGGEMFSKMDSLQSKANDISHMAESSIGKQKQLLDGQSAALDGLSILTTFQSEALEESRETLKQLSEFGHKQQEELLQRQEQLLRAHDNLVESSKTILSAQEAFESKQASIFVALDKLFALHNAMLLESRVIKAVLFYTFFVFVIQMFTSVKQTQNVRPRVYMGLFLTFLIEYVILRWTTTNIDRCGWLISLNRSIFGLLSLIQIIYAVCTYRDYNRLNHQILLDMAEGMNALRKEKMLSSCDSDADSELDWSSWIDNELPEDVDKLEDPDYVYKEEVGENSIETSFLTKRYNLRSRS